MCTPTVVSTFINRMTLNFPFFGAFAFWAQIAFLGLFSITALTSFVWTPRTIGADVDDDDFAEEEEEESLLAETRRRMGAAWEDIHSRAEASTASDSRATGNHGINDV